MDSELRSSLTGFAARFCNELEKERNFICSPLSCEVLLALTALGCEGDSRTELLQAIGLSDDAAIHSTFTFVSKKLKSVKGVKLRLANKVYVTKDGALKPSIKKDAEKVFNCGLEQVDFEDSDAAADIINKWVAKQTNDKIQCLFPHGSIEDTTRLVLVNAIYFQGSWEFPFKNTSTARDKFHVNNTTTIQVLMMKMDSFPSQGNDQKFNYKHSPELKAKLLQMYYKGREASMIFILPDEVEGLEALLQQLVSGYHLMKEIDSIKRIVVDIGIPKFKIESDIDLKTLLPKNAISISCVPCRGATYGPTGRTALALSGASITLRWDHFELGIKTIFDSEDANINMLQSGESLFVSQAIQKAIIEVDELGTEAAAASAVNCQIERMHCKVPNPRFIADHPFLYLLESHQVPLFLGAYRGCPAPDASELMLVEDEMLKKLRHIMKARHPPPPN